MATLRYKGELKITNQIDGLIKNALKEDLGYGDITTKYLDLQRSLKVSAVLKAEEDGVLCGIEIFERVFKILDPNARLKRFLNDASLIKKGQSICRITACASSLFAGERTALNFISRLSGIATLTNRFVSKIGRYKTVIMDTRKTTPGFRVLEKYAVRCGGGINHRMGLWEHILIKDNHISLLRALYGTINLGTLIRKLRKRTVKKIEVEVQNFNEFTEVLDGKPDIIMFDNMKSIKIKKAVQIARARYGKNIQLEVSGGVNLRNILQYASTGVDRISIGTLTHSAPSLDFTLEIEKGLMSV